MFETREACWCWRRAASCKMEFEPIKLLVLIQMWQSSVNEGLEVRGRGSISKASIQTFGNVSGETKRASATICWNNAPGRLCSCHVRFAAHDL